MGTSKALARRMLGSTAYTNKWPRTALEIALSLSIILNGLRSIYYQLQYQITNDPKDAHDGMESTELKGYNQYQTACWLSMNDS